MIPARFFDRLKFWDWGNTVTVPLPLVCMYIFFALDTLAASILVQDWNRSLIAGSNNLLESDRKLGNRAEEFERVQAQLEQAQAALMQREDELERSEEDLRRADAKLKRACEGRN